MHKKLLTLTLNIAIVPNLWAMGAVIGKYQPNRDHATVAKILQDNYAHLTYESRGCPAGTTEKYLTSSKYITDVVRVNDKTVGFVNYAAYDVDFFNL